MALIVSAMPVELKINCSHSFTNIGESVVPSRNPSRETLVKEGFTGELFSSMRMNLKQVVRPHVVQVKTSDTEPASRDPATKINVDLAGALKRDFKIFGIVGGDRQKDCLSFVSLFRQVDADVKAVLP